jgi:hypothetical protein
MSYRVEDETQNSVRLKEFDKVEIPVNERIQLLNSLHESGYYYGVNKMVQLIVKIQHIRDRN